jgi:hypothetical protein
MILRKLISMAVLSVVSTATSGCNSSLTSLGELDGCYFGNASSPVFSIVGNDVKDATGNSISRVTISAQHTGASVIRFEPGLRFTENVHKSLTVVNGGERFALAFSSFGRIHIVSSAASIPLDFLKKDCG